MLASYALYRELHFMARADVPCSAARKLLSTAHPQQTTPQLFFGHLFGAPDSPLLRNIDTHTPQTLALMAQAVTYISAPPMLINERHNAAELALRDVENLPWNKPGYIRACHAACAAGELIASYAYAPYLRDSIDSIINAIGTPKTRAYMYLAKLFLQAIE